MNAEAHYPPLIEKLRAIPGVRQVGYTSVFPRRLTLIGSDVGFVGEEFTGVRTSLDSVSPNFFDMMRHPLIAGRTFTEADTRTSRRVVIVSESLAQALAPDGAVIGRRLEVPDQPRDAGSARGWHRRGFDAGRSEEQPRRTSCFHRRCKARSSTRRTCCSRSPEIRGTGRRRGPPRRARNTGASSSTTSPWSVSLLARGPEA